MISKICILLALLCLAFTPFLRAAHLPRLEKRGAATQLIVDGKPFLILGGELHNSSASSREYMKPIWPKLKQMNLNTVLAVVSWDQLEPVEGKFDFTVLDGMLTDARRYDLRLVLLWFGSWKNGQSHYVPGWVKADYQRFPRARLKAGTAEVLSTLSEANVEADRRAFAALMKHLREVDSRQNTVIMVQVENEVGLLGDSRDRSELANAAFARPVPAELMAYLQSHKDSLLPEFRKLWEAAGFKAAGTWEEVFGAGAKTDEIFMGWNYARYLDRLVEAGKAEYPLPMFVNAWIVQPEDKTPGDYPCGGPQGHMLDLWRAGAPKADIYAPDIYLPNFPAVCEEFVRNENTLFVPESRGGVQGMANAFSAIGQFRSIGYSPFGIDSDPDPTNGPIHHTYEVLAQLAPLILEHQAEGGIAGIWLTQSNSTQLIKLGHYTLTATLRANRRNAAADGTERGYGLVMQLGADEFLAAGGNVQITFAANSPGPQYVGLASVEEGKFVKGKWTPGRLLNGDEVMYGYKMAELVAQRQTGTGLRFQSANPTIQRVKLYRYE
ncbi:MAG: DUF5597 domain-containing protein [Akkermansiaceae bacterium]|nr:DUF5597 domain-containing protein [Verrucomicrobiales bacterium]